MTEGQVLDIVRDAIYNIIICAAPLLLISLIVGLIVSIFQTVTSIQEQTLTFVPKIVAVFLNADLWCFYIDNIDRLHDGIVDKLQHVFRLVLVCYNIHLI